MDEVLSLDGGRSFGILTRAAADARGRAVVLFNAGLIHRVGPFRLHVHLARRLAAQGFDVFRFDLPRIGDAPAGSHATQESAAREALDSVQAATGATSFIVGGLCSAADLSWKVAVAEPRVDGLLLIDSMAVRSRWFRVGQLQLLLRRPISSWPRMAWRFFKPAKPADGPGLADFRDWPDHAIFKSDLEKMLERGVKVLALYTGGVAHYLLHRRQLDATFGASRRHPGLQVHYWPGVDHLVFVPPDRQRMVERISEWSAGG
jgi:hypothetical protein